MGGRVVHFEVPFDDAERALRFYREVFGWEIQAAPEFQYNLVSTGPGGEHGPTEPGYIGGGMMQRAEPVVAPVITIDVDDIDAACKAIAAHGGSAVGEKMAVGDMGFAAYFRDSEGNLLGLWQSAG